MHVLRLDVQGFKTFANKTSLAFLSPQDGACGITSIVGPNGSGKSNLSDAMRWVLGEQSMKLLRGKKSEDVIFSGSTGRARSGFAEVSITFDNTKHEMPLEASEVAITRRLYRDGESEYLVNNRPARLADIQLLLAEANVGQRSYCVIGQGMVDHILISTPEERKAFFDDATGVKPLQLKRHQAFLKLRQTCENLNEAHRLLQEIEPRVRSLKRQVNRLQQREEVESELTAFEQEYYGTLWWQLQDRLASVRTQVKNTESSLQKERSEFETLEAQSESFGQEGGQVKGLQEVQERYRHLQKDLSRAREERFIAEREMELVRIRAQASWTPLPLEQIKERVEDVVHQQAKLLETVKTAKNLSSLGSITVMIEKVWKASIELLDRLKRPEEKHTVVPAALEERKKHAQEKERALGQALEEIEHQMDVYADREKEERQAFVESQRTLRECQRRLQEGESQRHAYQIELARLDERRIGLEREIMEHMKDRAGGVWHDRRKESSRLPELQTEIQRLRYKLELIGGIDPEAVKEYEETHQRFEFLSAQFSDLEKAMTSTEKVIDALDAEVAEKSQRTFKEINKEFQRYFKILFGGGSCGLVKLTKEEAQETGVSLERAQQETGEEVREEVERDIKEEARFKFRERDDRVVGIEIQATPPGKRLKALNLLSGGERALTSIALLSAIMAVNPSPFVVLDEVDAALDEANTYRFAEILEELRRCTQFIVITHNRATMSCSDVLYGVTMGEDGTSRLLSVRLQDLQEKEKMSV
jgi:chromosome segregation protein